MSERIWIRVFCPISIKTLSELTAAAPKNTFVRNGGKAIIAGEMFNVMEFVTAIEESSQEREEVHR